MAFNELNKRVATLENLEKESQKDIRTSKQDGIEFVWFGDLIVKILRGVSLDDL